MISFATVALICNTCELSPVWCTVSKNAFGKYVFSKLEYIFPLSSHLGENGHLSIPHNSHYNHTFYSSIASLSTSCKIALFHKTNLSMLVKFSISMSVNRW